MQAGPRENRVVTPEHEQRQRRVSLVELTQRLLSNFADDTDIILIQAAWIFQRHLTKQHQNTPSRLPALLFDRREGKLDPATLEAQFYDQGATRTENAFLAALREVPLTGAPKESAQRAEAILKFGGEHAVQACGAVETLLDGGDIGGAKSTIYDYGGVQALTMYAITKRSDLSIDRVVRSLPPSHISWLLDCISNVRIHRDVSHMIETMFRTRRRPHFKPKKTHIGRATPSKGTSHKHDQSLPQPAPQSGDLTITPNMARGHQGEMGFVAPYSLGDANQARRQSPHSVPGTTSNQQLDQSVPWPNPSARGTDPTIDIATQDLVPDVNDSILLDSGEIQFSEQDLSLFVRANFHLPENL